VQAFNFLGAKGFSRKPKSNFAGIRCQMVVFVNKGNL
jgi:hypothetical protein